MRPAAEYSVILQIMCSKKIEIRNIFKKDIDKGESACYNN